MLLAILNSTSILNLGHHSKTPVITKPYTRKLIVTSFMTARNWKEPRCQSTGVWVNQLWNMETNKYHSDILLIIFSLKCFSLGEISQSERNTYHNIQIYNMEHSRKGWAIETGERLVVRRGSGARVRDGQGWSTKDSPGPLHQSVDTAMGKACPRWTVVNSSNHACCPQLHHTKILITGEEE